MNAATCNGFKIRGLNQDANSVSIQSNVQTTWMLTRRKFAVLTPQWYEVGITRDELIVIKGQESSRPEIELVPLGDKAGTLIGQSSRKATRSMRVGSKYVWQLDPGEALVLRSENIVYPTHGGAGLTV
jgi:hypothetical protein